MEDTSHTYIQSKTIKLMTALVLSLFFYDVMFAQNEPDTLAMKERVEAEEFRKLEQELLDYVEKGVSAKLISTGLRDSILQYIQETKMALQGRFFRFTAAANAIRYDSLPPHQVIRMRDGIPFLVDTLQRDSKLAKKRLDLVLEKSPRETLEYAGTPFRKSGVDEATLYPDKLPVPERDKTNKNKHQYWSQEEIKQNILRMDYFSKGMDGYYQKQIALGQTGQGWEETREMRELVTRVKAQILANLYPDGLVREPQFLGKMNSSRNPFVKFLGGLLGMFQNGAMQQMNSGFKTTNPLAPIPVPARR